MLFSLIAKGGLQLFGPKYSNSQQKSDLVGHGIFIVNKRNPLKLFSSNAMAPAIKAWMTFQHLAHIKSMWYSSVIYNLLNNSLNNNLSIRQIFVVLCLLTFLTLVQ